MIKARKIAGLDSKVLAEVAAALDEILRPIGIGVSVGGPEMPGLLYTSIKGVLKSSPWELARHLMEAHIKVSRSFSDHIRPIPPSALEIFEQLCTEAGTRKHEAAHRCGEVQVPEHRSFSNPE
jgi:hypothetical protein